MINRMNLSKDASKLFLIPELYLNLVLTPDLLDLHVRIEHLSKLTRGTLVGLRCRYTRPRRFLFDRKQRSKVFCLTHCQIFLDYLLSKFHPAFLGRHGKDGSSMASRQKSLLDHLLDHRRKVHEPQGIRYGRARL